MLKITEKSAKKTRGGFIQIPLIWAVFVITGVASVGAGVVLYEQGKIFSSSDDVAEVSQKATVVSSLEDNWTEKDEIDETDTIITAEKDKEAEEVVTEDVPQTEERRSPPNVEGAESKLERLEQQIVEEEAKIQKEQREAILRAEELQQQEQKRIEEEIQMIEEAMQELVEQERTFQQKQSDSSTVSKVTAVDPNVEYLYNNNAVIVLSDSFWRDDREFLGVISSKFNVDSVLNRFGNYGSKFSINSIWNKFGSYGGKFSSESPFNKFTSTPPEIYIDNTFWGYLSVNEYMSGNVLNPNDLLLFAYLKYDDDNYLDLMITD